MVYLFLAEGFEETEVIYPYDLMCRAGVEVRFVSITDQKEVMGKHEVRLTAHLTLGELSKETPELVMLPGGMPGTNNLQASEALKQYVLRAHRDGAFVAAICAAPKVLGAYGLLKGKKAVCYPGFEEELIGAEVLNVPAVRDGEIITGRAAGAAEAFGLLLVEALRGKQTADKVKADILA